MTATGAVLSGDAASITPPTIPAAAPAAAEPAQARVAPVISAGSNAPIFWLLAFGAVLMFVSLIFFGHWEGGAPGKQYVPPVYRDGVIVPGHVE